MATLGEMSLTVRLVPDSDTMDVILKLLNLWQESNPDKMVALVPAKDNYRYEIISSGRKKKNDD